ncbi:MAG: hypothetical protein IJ398_06185 [Clostridia bacterium]|nr:hypothetical protein [Clostridia bacterium]
MIILSVVCILLSICVLVLFRIVGIQSAKIKEAQAEIKNANDVFYCIVKDIEYINDEIDDINCQFDDMCDVLDDVVENLEHLLPYAYIEQRFYNDEAIELTNKQSKMRGLLAPYMQALFVTFSNDMKMFFVSDLEHRYYVSFYRNHEYDEDDSWYMHFLDVENNVVIRDEACSFSKVLEKINNYYTVRGIRIEVSESENT